MAESYIKKIVLIEELESLAKDFEEIFKEDNENFTHACGLKHDMKLMLTSFSHETLLTWHTHVWGHFNGEKWDGIFAGILKKSEKFGKKMFEEYLWLSKNSNSGIKLYKTALDFAKSKKCEYISMNVVDAHPSSSKIKKIYTALGFQKDSETYIKKL
jgi:hypothetical protein